MKPNALEMLFAALIAALPLAAQEQPPAKLVESIDVRVINIDVVVTDRKGNRIKGLKPQDFEIYENGTPKTVSNFYEVDTAKPAAAPKAKPAPVPAPAPPAGDTVISSAPDSQQRRFIIFIDNLSLMPFNRNPVFKALKNFLQTGTRPDDQFMVATWNRSMKVRVPFTTDITQVEQMLDVVAGETSYGLHNASERKDVEKQISDSGNVDDAIIAARGYAQSVEHDLRQTVDALNGLLSTLAGVEGKKVLILTSQGLPMTPGKELFFYIDEMARQKGWRSTGSTLLQASNFDSTSLIQSIARTANANAITIYALHAGGLGSYNEGSAENATPTPYTVQQAAITNTTDSMQLVAAMTGGIAAVGTNNFDGALQTLENDLNTYYSLGYRSGTERVDRQRILEVKAKNRHYVVRSRRSFVEKSIRTEMNDRVIANLFYDRPDNDMKITLTTRQPVPNDEYTFKVPLEIHIPMEKITLLPQGETITGGFSVYVVVSDQNGDMSDVVSQQHQIRVTPDELSKMNGKYFTYEIDLVMEKGRNRISVGVVDDIANTTGFERQEVLAKDLR